MEFSFKIFSANITMILIKLRKAKTLFKSLVLLLWQGRTCKFFRGHQVKKKGLKSPKKAPSFSTSPEIYGGKFNNSSFRFNPNSQVDTELKIRSNLVNPSVRHSANTDYQWIVLTRIPPVVLLFFFFNRIWINENEVLDDPSRSPIQV